MKKIDLGQTISIFANIGVIAGIVFLALELRQNNELLTVQARSNTLSARTRANELIIESPWLPEIYAKARNGEPLESDEVVRLQAVHQYLFTMMQWTYEDYTALGLDPAAPVGRYRAAFRGEILTPGLRETWPTWKQSAPQEFVQFIEENVISQVPQQ